MKNLIICLSILAVGLACALWQAYQLDQDKRFNQSAAEVCRVYDTLEPGQVKGVNP